MAQRFNLDKRDEQHIDNNHRCKRFNYHSLTHHELLQMARRHEKVRIPFRFLFNLFFLLLTSSPLNK